MVTAFTSIASPLGELLVSASSSGLTGVYFPLTGNATPAEREGWVEDNGDGPASALLARARQQLEEYFVRTRTTFDLPLAPSGTAFQRSVWDAFGGASATRAVGAANGKNPIPIIVPCHRVVGSRGELTGFGGGLNRKRWLLEHEGAALVLT